MKMLHDIQFADGTKCGFGFADYYTEYKDDYPIWFMDQLIALVQVAVLNDGVFSPTDDSVEIILEQIPKDNGNYLLKPKDGGTGVQEPISILNFDMNMEGVNVHAVKLEFKGMLGCLLNSLTSEGQNIWFIKMEAVGVSAIQYIVGFDLSKIMAGAGG